MPAIAMPGASFPTYSHYFARPPGAMEQKVNVGLVGSAPPQQPLPLSSNWSVGRSVNYGLQSPSTWPLAGNQTAGVPYVNPGNRPLSVPHGWQNGDWICNCGYHNYSSRSQCKNCNASIAPALGTKRLASEEFAHVWDNKRLNSGHGNGQLQPHPGFDQMGAATGPRPGAYPTYTLLNPGVASNWRALIPLSHQATTPTLIGKGAIQWRSGDWMCTKCNNHNYASRAQCNRCKTERDHVTQTVNAA
ncbi:Zinc finger, RanBP2-type [Corchorus capsularis]|uniref:Zinc finger, RanBP2-type n=1 Tax=Corchorus capsularis TaxID=210143 RepID=A0A1R3GG71_COCAP|nr:Zinc finger, RanBP2-type [Corchorus capsularis]